MIPLIKYPVLSIKNLKPTRVVPSFKVSPSQNLFPSIEKAQGRHPQNDWRTLPQDSLKHFSALFGFMFRFQDIKNDLGQGKNRNARNQKFHYQKIIIVHFKILDGRLTKVSWTSEKILMRSISLIEVSKFFMNSGT